MGRLLEILRQVQPNEGNEITAAPNAELTNQTIRAYTQMREMPFPMGYKGLPIETVVAAEAYSDLIGIRDPIKRKIRVLSWMLDHLRNETPLGQEMPPFYWDVKKEKHRLIHADYEQSGLPLECGYCDPERGSHESAED